MKEVRIMTTGKYLTVATLFALGVGLITFGAMSDAEMTLRGITVHARLAKPFGLITTLGSIITFLALYGSSLPPTQAERRLEAIRALRRGEQPMRKKQARGSWDRPSGNPPPVEPHSAVSMGRGTTESWIRVAAERKNRTRQPLNQ
jgi:hypothetical protein